MFSLRMVWPLMTSKKRKMTLDKLNQWLTLMANIGVVVGIFAVIVQLNHASKLAEVSAFQARMTEIQEAQVQVALSEDLAELFVKYDSSGVESLTPAELKRVQAWEGGVLRRMQGQYFQYHKGFLDRLSIDMMLDGIANDAYERWDELGLLGLIQISEWREEIEKRVTQN